MVWTPAPADIYDQIRAALFRHKGEYFHPEYPEPWLDDRLRRYLPRLPFYVTDRCLLRPVAKRGYLCLEQMVAFGPGSVRHARAMTALAYDLTMRLALPILAESFNPVRHRLAGHVSEEELQFPLLNDQAQDPWDAALGSPQAHRPLNELLASLSEDVETTVSPLNVSIYFDEERGDAVDIVAAVSGFARVMHVSSCSRAFTRHLHARLAAAGRDVGKPRINYITTVPRRDVLERLRERERRDPVAKHILLKGRLHAF